MILKKTNSAIFLAFVITAIYALGWGVVVFLFESRTGSGRSLLWMGGVCITITTFLVFLILRMLLKKRADLESRLLLADEALETRVKIRTAELENSLNQLNGLKGIIPICSHCKSIRNSGGQWERIEVYIQRHSGVQFSHGLCSVCDKALYGDRRIHFETIAGKYT